jgi:hypothetical protein
MTTDNFCFYLQIRLIQTRQMEGQWYSDTPPFSIPWLGAWVVRDTWPADIEVVNADMYLLGLVVGVVRDSCWGGC